MSDAQFGLLTSVFLWVYGIFSPFVGFLADRTSRSKVIIVSLFAWSLATLFTGFSDTFGELLITRALMGISEACYFPAALALIMDYHRGSTRSLASGVNMVGIMIGSGLGFLGGWIAEKYTWTLAFHIFGIIGIAYAFVLVFSLRDAPKNALSVEEKSTPQKVKFIEAIKKLFSMRSYILMVLFWTALGTVGWLIVGWLPTFFKERFGLTQTMAGVYATGYFYPAGIVGLLLGGFIADQWNKVNARGRILTPVIGLAIASPCVFIASQTNVLWIAILFFMIYNLTRMFGDANMMPILSMIAGPRYRATGYGIFNLFATVIGGLSIYVGGILRDADIGFSKIFQASSILLLACAIFMYFVRPSGKNP
jgi:MFS family permease